MSDEEKLQLENECLLNYSKAQMIQKYIDELEENCILSDLWCKSQEENKQLKSIIKEVREEIIKDREKNYSNLEKKAFYCNKTDKLLEILEKENK